LNVFAHIVMIGWIPAVLALFALLPPRRAMIISFIGAWLFLPMASYPLPGLPDYTKMSATCVGVFLATLIFDTGRVLRFRPTWVDVPLAIFCGGAFVSSITNGLGVWDGVSSALWLSITWGLPYFLGRVYFTDARSLRELAVGIVVGGLLYVPLCLFEMRMSPQLHYLVYGFFKRLVQVRFGGWRPAVFMDGGLELGMWMTAASLCALWLWKTGSLKRLYGISAGWLIVPLVVTTILCRATGALSLLAVGLAVIWFCSATKSRIAFVCLLAIVPAYIGLRATNSWNGEPVISMATMLGKDRSGSLKFRMDNENMLAAKARQRPLFGWGNWGRERVYDEWGRDLSITDGLWIIQLGANGVVGLTGCFTTMLLPLAMLTTRVPARRLTTAQMAPAIALAVLGSLYAIDCLSNAMINPVFTLANGAVISFAVTGTRERVPTMKELPRSGNAEAVPPRRLYPTAV
jgi:hypothetical protein